MSRTEELRASPPMFKSPLLDRFTRVHVAVVPSIFVPLIVLFAVLALREEAALTVVAAAALVVVVPSLALLFVLGQRGRLES